VAAVNGFDSFGHYLRAGLLVNQCSNYALTPVFGCSANFSQANTTSATAAAASSGDRSLLRIARALAGEPVAPKTKAKAKAKAKEKEKAPAAPVPQATPAPTATPAPQKPSKTETLLDYLFGGDQ
jgi:hypothetical protein